MSLGSTYFPKTGALKTSSGFLHSTPSSRDSVPIDVQFGGNSGSLKSGAFNFLTLPLMHSLGLKTSRNLWLSAFSLTKLKSSATFFNFLIYPGRLKNTELSMFAVISSESTCLAFLGCYSTTYLGFTYGFSWT